MESLSQEMNVVRVFEALLLNGISENGSDGVLNRRGLLKLFIDFFTGTPRMNRK
jgi:hypothetical protein